MSPYASYAGGDTALNSDCGHAVHKVYCDAVAAGVTFVAAAGNGGVDANRTRPATYDEVITVSNLVDSDGKRGARAGYPGHARRRHRTPQQLRGRHRPAAPGTDILSTVPKIASTLPLERLPALTDQQAAPHVAGAAALYIAQNGNVGPAAVKAASSRKKKRGT
jgi:subtilisin family serine protease